MEAVTPQGCARKRLRLQRQRRFLFLSEPGQQLLKSLFQEFQNVKIVQESARVKRIKGAQQQKKSIWGDSKTHLCFCLLH